MSFIFGLLAANPLLFQLAQAENGGNGEAVSGFQTYGMWVIIALMLVVFYFLLIRPQRKRAQEQQSMLSKLSKGDEVVTIGGIQGVIKKLTDDSVVLEVDKGVRMTFVRSAISRRLTEPEPEEEQAEEELEEEYEYDEEELEEEAEEELEEE